MEINLQHGVQIAHRHTGSFLFVVSHMRSFSSLLCHILGSHPEISGYAEMHLSYLGRPDLDRLARKVREMTDNAPLRRYVLDKLLHNYRQLMPRVFERPDVKIVFLLRNAEDSPLSAEYRTFQHTGESGYGDPSANIRRGSVVSDAEERHRDYVPLPLPADVIRRGVAFHAACRDVLARNAGGD